MKTLSAPALKWPFHYGFLSLLLLAGFAAHGQAPTISYSTPQTYTGGAAITPLTPTSSGVAAAGYGGEQTIATGFNYIAGMTVDAAGNVYVADFNTGNITKIPPIGAPSVYCYVEPSIQGISMDAAGNMYVADYNASAVKKIPPGGGTPTVALTTATGPMWAVADAAGDLFVTMTNTSVVTEFPAGGGPAITIGSGVFSVPDELALDNSGNLYVSENKNHAIYRVPLSTKVPVLVSNQFNTPAFVTVDPGGNIFVGDDVDGHLYEIPAGGGGAPINLGSGGFGVAVDGAGNLFTCVPSQVSKLAPTGGYYLNKFLPAGLNFSESTGTISGTPTTASAATNYTVTAYNANGSSAATLNIAVSNPPSPTITAGTATGNISACAGTASSSPNIQQFTASGIGLTDNITATAPAGFEVSLTATSGYGGSVILTQTGGNLGNTILYVRSAASDGSGGISGNVVLTSTGASTQNIAVTGTVNALPTVNSVSNQTVLNGAATAAINFTGTGNTFTWVNDTPGIGLAAGGAGNIASFTAVNTGTGPVTATISATPVLAGFAYIANGSSNNVSVINTKTHAVVATILVGRQPSNSFVSPDGSKVYTSDLSSNVISVINTATNTVITTIPINAPNELFVSPDGSRLYADNTGIDTVTVINTATNSVIAKIGTGAGSQPDGMWGSPDGRQVYLACWDGNVRVLSTATNMVIATIPIGSSPTGITVSPDGNKVYVANQKTVSVINTATNTVTASISDGASPYNVAISPDGKFVYVTNNSSNSVSVINTATNSVIATIVVGSSPTGICVTPDGAQVYVANLGSANASVINTASNTVIATIPIGSGAYSFGNFITPGVSCPGTPVTFTVTVNPTPPPTISYSGPQTYTVGTAIIPLAPTSSGVAAAGYSGSPVTLATGFNFPRGVALDAGGNIYVVDAYNNLIKKIPVGGGPIVTLGSGFNNPNAIAVDVTGNVYVGDYGSKTIKKIPVGGGPVITIGTGFGAAGLAVDAVGNVYVGDFDANAVREIRAGGRSIISLGSGFKNPQSVALDAIGDVYVADWGNNQIKEIPVAGGGVVTLGSGFSGPQGVAVDAAGNVYVADWGNHAVKEIPAYGGPITTLGAGFSSPNCVVLDPAGNLYVTDENNTLKKITPAGGYFVSPALPAGLIFNSNTGVISGTPATASPATNYTVTAYNTGGSSSATLNIKVPPNNANLASLHPSTANTPLTPSFSPGVFNYSVGEGYITTAITLTPTAADANATITVNGQPVVSGAASQSIPLQVGPNIVTTVVTAQDGVTTQTYTFTVNRTGSDNAYLAGLLPSAGPIIPLFKPYIFGYTSNVDNSVSSITISPTTADPNATITVNGTAVASGIASAPIPLSTGENTITTTVTAQDGVTTKTYTLTVAKGLPDANLVSVTISSGAVLSFPSTTTNYSTTVGNDVPSVTLTPLTSSPGATVTVDGAPVASGTASGPITLQAFGNNIPVVVTASDGITTKTYTITVIRTPSDFAWLADLSLNGGTVPLSPSFNFKTMGYTANVYNSTSTITLTPLNFNDSENTTVNGTAVASKADSPPIALAVGSNTITIVVTAQDGVTTQTYTVTVTRASGGADAYQAISVSDPAIAPSLLGGDIKVHQGVSPNGDGVNDVLTIDDITNYPQNKLMIMDRNGAMIFLAKGYDNVTKAFDGHSNLTGRMQLPGTYFYALDYTVNGITKRKTGFIVLKY